MLERRRPVERFPRLGERLAATSRRRIRGRDGELGLFRRALVGSSAPFSVFFVHGLGGVGKSALLDECANEAARAGVLTVHLDGRNIDPVPRAFLHALGETLLPQLPARGVVMIAGRQPPSAEWVADPVLGVIFIRSR